MVNITRPGNLGQLSSANISSANTGAGAAAIGNQVVAGANTIANTNPGANAIQIGNEISQLGARYFEQSKQAHQTGMLSSRLADATIEFVKQRDNRFNMVTDAKGNPTFTTLPNDIKTIGDNISASVAKQIDDPDVARQFSQDFGKYVTDQQLSSMRVARSQQVDFSRTALDKGLGTLLLQGANDTIDNVRSYDSQGKKLLDDALRGGIISPSDHLALGEQFSGALSAAAIVTTIQTDPNTAARVLSSDHKALGISEQQKGQLSEALTAKVSSDRDQKEAGEQQQKADLLNKQAVLAEEIDSAIEAGAVREDQLLLQRNNLAPAAFSQLKGKFMAEAKKRQDERQLMLRISNSITSGDSTDSYTINNINTHYERLSEAASQSRGRAIGLNDKATIANTYRRGVPSFAKEVNTSLISGSDDKAEEAISAYTYVRDRKGLALNSSAFTSEAEAIAESAELLIERGGLSAKDAIAKARESVLEADTTVRKMRNTQYSTVPAFKSNKIADTLADDVGAEGFLWRNKALSDDSISTYARLTRQAYVETGDESYARKLAASRMNLTHGLSDVNGTSEYMYNPPSILYPELKGKDAEVRTQLEADVSTLGTVDPKSVRILADEATRGKFVRIKRADGSVAQIEHKTYAVTQMKELSDGSVIEVPLTNPKTGELVRWSPNVETILKGQQDNSIKSAQRIDSVVRNLSSKFSLSKDNLKF